MLVSRRHRVAEKNMQDARMTERTQTDKSRYTQGRGGIRHDVYGVACVECASDGGTRPKLLNLSLRVVVFFVSVQRALAL